ncbi:MAG: cytochrome c nitrite reductase small subunit [Gemmatales bacterium]|nr:cytochrome c nitrite reductase small subunit [Gemmatales bacterium]MCS7160691.1 cytochrome c nitrite reductase small subunit [Gemmatales bacterium]MDW8175892.1 cytochrome c nitrite reductase small subunit [Gemmatales bacterium]MDW8223339.1 cytochrome c nitrite reductase small subunit [Gemmatales bacterium]
MKFTEALSACCGVSLSGLALSALVGVLLGAGAYTIYYAEATSYLRDEPTACINCHIMREHYESWQKAGHHTVAVCNDCHLPHRFVGKWTAKLRNGFFHSKAFTFQDFHEPILIHPWNHGIVQANCVACHRELAQHILLAGQPDCIRCHQAAGHGPRK